MKNKNLIIIAVVIILLLGAGLFYTMNKSNSPSQSGQTEKINTGTDNTGNKMEEIEGSLKSLIGGGKNIQCTYSNTTEDITMTGKVMTANGKVRQDYQSTTAAGNMSGHMILEGQDAYMWTDQMAQGFKFSIAGQPTPADTKNNQTPDIDKTMRFSCQPWNVDASVFTLPANITFQSMSVPAVPPSGTMQKGQPNNSNMCAVCNNIPEGEDRDTCKAQLNCP